MKVIAEVLEVSRSNMYELLKQGGKRTRECYTKKEDQWLVPMIRSVIDKHVTYGYPRTTAVLRKELLSSGKEPVNKKRVYRIMKENDLCSQRHTGKATRTHTGKIITLMSNLRWCSDIMAINCWNGDRVSVAFSLDCCDREAMKYISTSRGIDGEMIRDLMTETVEHRFGKVEKVPHKIEWLSDNGPQFTAHETIAFGRGLGLEICTTPAYSPESNGMAEAFVKTFKRDYVYVSDDLSTAETVMKQLPTWFEDYNKNAPHKGLKMMSPYEFRRQQLAG